MKKRIFIILLATGVLAGTVFSTNIIDTDAIYARDGFLGRGGFDHDLKGKAFDHEGAKKLEHLSEFLGMTSDEIKSLKEESDMTIWEIAESKGFTKEDMRKYREEKMIEKLKDKGLSDEEIAEKIAKMNEYAEERKQKHEERVAKQKEDLKNVGFSDEQVETIFEIMRPNKMNM